MLLPHCFEAFSRFPSTNARVSQIMYGLEIMLLQSPTEGDILGQHVKHHSPKVSSQKILRKFFHKLHWSFKCLNRIQRVVTLGLGTPHTRIRQNPTESDGIRRNPMLGASNLLVSTPPTPIRRNPTELLGRIPSDFVGLGVEGVSKQKEHRRPKRFRRIPSDWGQETRRFDAPSVGFRRIPSDSVGFWCGGSRARASQPAGSY